MFISRFKEVDNGTNLLTLDIQLNSIQLNLSKVPAVWERRVQKSYQV